MAVAEAIEHSVHLVVNCSVPIFFKHINILKDRKTVVITESSIAKKNYMSFEKILECSMTIVSGNC